MRLRTVIEIVSKAQIELGIAQKPVSSAVNSFDQDINQMVALLFNVADELLIEEPYRITMGDDMWICDKDGVPKPTFTADTDLVMFDSRLTIDGLKYRFLKAKGLEYGEELRDFTNRMNKIAGRVNAKIIDLYSDEGRVV